MLDRLSAGVPRKKTKMKWNLFHFILNFSTDGSFSLFFFQTTKNTSLCLLLSGSMPWSSLFYSNIFADSVSNSFLNGRMSQKSHRYCLNNHKFPFFIFVRRPTEENNCTGKIYNETTFNFRVNVRATSKFSTVLRSQIRSYTRTENMENETVSSILNFGRVYIHKQTHTITVIWFFFFFCSCRECDANTVKSFWSITFGPKTKNHRFKLSYLLFPVEVAFFFSFYHFSFITETHIKRHELNNIMCSIIYYCKLQTVFCSSSSFF